MSEDGFHEIQLNGKQLVFLFMTGTVVAVSIFLLGFLAGRGVRTPRVQQSVEASAAADGDPTASTQASTPAPSVSPDGVSASTQETLTYPERLEDPTPPPETLRDATEPVPPPTPKASARATAPEPAPVAAPKSTTAAAAVPPAQKPAPSPGSTTAEPSGTGYVVQVAAVRERREAESIAHRLASKGYPSFVTTTSAGAFRVRVGKYADRKQADAIAARLQNEEQFKPWVTR
jgi:DedD protein